MTSCTSCWTNLAFLGRRGLEQLLGVVDEEVPQVPQIVRAPWPSTAAAAARAHTVMGVRTDHATDSPEGRLRSRSRHPSTVGSRHRPHPGGQYKYVNTNLPCTPNQTDCTAASNRSPAPFTVCFTACFTALLTCCSSPPPGTAGQPAAGFFVLQRRPLGQPSHA